MSRAARLQSGRHWLRSFSGTRVVPSYARWFGVDLICAAKELQVLGMHFSPEYLGALRRTAAARARHCRDVPKGAKAVDIEPARNQKFAYIAGYTEAGLPFGITWEETAGLDDDDVCSRETTSRKAILRCRGESVAVEMGERSRALQYSTGGHYGSNVHKATRAVPHIHRNVHEAASTATGGSGHSSVLSGDAAISAQHDRHARAAGSYFENAWRISIDSGPRGSRATPTVGVTRTDRAGASSADQAARACGMRRGSVRSVRPTTVTHRRAGHNGTQFLSAMIANHPKMVRVQGHGAMWLCSNRGS